LAVALSRYVMGQGLAGLPQRGKER